MISFESRGPQRKSYMGGGPQTKMRQSSLGGGMCVATSSCVTYPRAPGHAESAGSFESTCRGQKRPAEKRRRVVLLDDEERRALWPRAVNAIRLQAARFH